MIDADPWLRRLAWALEGPPDAAAVHAIRVASRRLDVWLALGGHRVLRDDLARLRSVLGPLRDLDVLTGLARTRAVADDRAFGPLRPGTEDLPALEERRRGVGSRVAARLVGEWTGALVEALALVPGVDRAEAAGRIPRFLHRVEARGRRFEASAAPGADPSGADAALHGLRRAVRRARFALDWVGRPSRDLEALHDAFGRVTDLVLVQRWLREERPDVVQAASVGAEAAASAGVEAAEWAGVEAAVSAGVGAAELAGVEAALAGRRREALEAWLESDAARRALRRAWR